METLELIDCRHLIGKYPSYADSSKSFKIKSMKNTIYYKIGDFLSESTVQELIQIAKWTIIIKEQMEI